MKELSTYIMESLRGRDRVKKSPEEKKYYDEYLQYFDITDNYRRPVNLDSVATDWDNGNNVPKNQPKGSIVIGTKGSTKGKAILTNNGNKNLYDEIITLSKDKGDLDLYVQLNYHEEVAIYPICKVSDEGESNVMVSVAPNVKIKSEL